VKMRKALKGISLAVGFLASGFAAASPIDDLTQLTIEDANEWLPAGLKSRQQVAISGIQKGVDAGMFDLDATVVGGGYVNLLAFCLQPEARLETYDNPYTAHKLGSAFGQEREFAASGIAKLWAEYRDDVVSGKTAAAFQLAVWELASDGATDLADGGFRVLDLTVGSAGAMAQEWLSSLANLTRTAGNLYVLKDDAADPDRQDLLIQTPLPGTLGLVGLGLLGLGAIRRKTQA